MKKLILILIACTFSMAVFSQEKKKNKKAKVETKTQQIMEEEEPVFQDMDIDEEAPVIMEATEEIMMEEPPRRYSNNKYETYRIYGDYEWFYEKNSGGSYSRKKGIMYRGEIILPMIFKGETYYNSNNLQGYIKLGLDNTYGLYNLEERTWSIPIMYTQITSLGKNMFSVGVDKKFGIVDIENNIILDFDWSAIVKVAGLDNYVQVSNTNGYNKLYGIYSITQGKLTVPVKYKNIYKTNIEGYFKVFDGNTYTLVDINDKPKFKNTYKEMHDIRERRRFIVKRDGKMGIIDFNEKEIVPVVYKDIKTYPYNDGYNLTTVANNVLISGQDDKCGIIKVNNGLPFEITTCDYDDIDQTNQSFIIQQGKKYGIMDLYGQLIVPLKYEMIQAISNKYYAAKNKGKWILMSKDGEQVGNNSYAGLQKLVDKEKRNSYYNKNEFTHVKIEGKNGKYGVMDKFGNEVIAPSFEDILFETGNNLIVKKGSKFGVYNLLKKKMILPSEYDQLVQSQTGFYGIKGNEYFKISLGQNAKVKKI